MAPLWLSIEHKCLLMPHTPNPKPSICYDAQINM